MKYSDLIRSKQFERYVIPYLFLLPILLGLIFFRLGPVIWSFILSFQRYNPIKGGTWIGLANYKELIGDKDFIQTFGNTVRFTLMYVPLGVVASLVLALLVNNRLKGVVLFRSFYFLPVISAVAATGAVWAWLLNPLYGLVNYLLDTWFNLKGPEWLGNPDTALGTIVMLNVWLTIGYNMVIFLAGLQGVPRELKEAAIVDGANKIKTFFRVTLPLISPTTFFIIIITVIRSFQIFDLVYILTSPAAGEGSVPGGPAGSTNVISISVFLNAFKYYRMGFAASQAYILFILVAIITFINFQGQKKWVHY